MRQNVLTGETHKDVAALMKWYADRDFEEELGEVETKGDQGRGAQEALGQLDLVFKNCVFEVSYRHPLNTISSLLCSNFFQNDRILLAKIQAVIM